MVYPITRFWFHMGSALVPAILALALLGPRASSAQAVAPQQMMELALRGDQAAIRASLAEEPPKGPQAALVAFFEPKLILSTMLGDSEVTLRLARKYVELLPDYVWAHNWMREANYWSGDFDRAIEWGLRTRNPKGFLYPTDQIFLGSRLAYVYVDAGRFAEARDLLASMKSTESVRQYEAAAARDQYWPTRSSAHYYEAYCEMALRTFQINDALQHCAKELALRESASKLVSQIGQPEHIASQTMLARGRVHMARTSLARAHALASQYFTAEQIFRRALDEARQDADTPIGRSNMVQVYHRFSEIRLLQGQFGEANEYATLAVKEAQIAERGFLGDKTVRAFEAKLKVGLATSAWQVLQADLAAIDQLAGDNAYLKARTGYPVARALVAAQQQDAARAVALLTQHLQTLRSNLGERHFEVALVTGLRGVVGAPGAQAAADLLQATSMMLQAGLPGAEMADQGERRNLRRMVLERFLGTLRDGMPAADIALGFSAADALRTNAVQKSIQAAALRHSLTDPALSAAVRSLQDAESMLQTLVDRLNALPTDVHATQPEQVTRLRQQIADAEKRRSEGHAVVSAKFSKFASLTRPPPASLHDVQRRLQAGEIMLALYPLAGGTAVWRVGREGDVQFRMVDMGAEAIDSSVRRLRQTLDVAAAGSNTPPFDAAAAQRLYETLVRPVLRRDEATTTSHIVFSLAGSLTQLPMGLLRTGSDTDNSARPWLIQSWAVSQITSASSWVALREADKKARATSPLMAWGDPAFAPGAAVSTQGTVRAVLPRSPSTAPTSRSLRYEQIPPLPETRDELTAIAQALNANPQRDLFLGSAADRDSVLAASKAGTLAQSRVVAFATHGLTPGELPDLAQPALALAKRPEHGDNPLAPLLTLSDILGLTVNADWVVLSACNTATSDGTSEEAISGLARGFFYAGARSVLATYWAVETTSAAMLTTETFRHHVGNPGASRAESLRQATIAVMNTKGFEHPAFWAPYALLGDGGN